MLNSSLKLWEQYLNSEVHSQAVSGNKWTLEIIFFPVETSTCFGILSDALVLTHLKTHHSLKQTFPSYCCLQPASHNW